MDDKKQKLTFDVELDQIDIRPLLKKEFLELKMKAISTANPNRNNSWFTEESLIKSLDSFRNKPILGYFKDGDFVSHNGDWQVDDETGMSYWDTCTREGERILGLIRENDELGVRKDENGLSWIYFSCALWVQYNFKQVKRLLKDAKKARDQGVPTKNISVEIDVTDYEELENGVTKINKFELVGVTILGSRNGIKVEPGIEGAELTVSGISGKDFFEKQKSALRMAYEKLEVQGEKDMENTDVKLENEALVENISALDSSEEKKTFEEVCPECGENPCKCEKKAEKCEESCGEGCEGEKAIDCEAGCEEADPKPEQEEKCDCGEEGKEEKFEAPQEETVLLSVYNELNGKYTVLEGEYNSIKENYDNLKKDYELIKEKLDDYEKKEFLKSAENLLYDSSITIEKDKVDEFYENCKNGTIKTYEELKSMVAIANLDKVFQNKKKEEFSAPVEEPDTTTIFENTKTKKKEKRDSWAELRNYIGK